MVLARPDSFKSTPIYGYIALESRFWHLWNSSVFTAIGCGIGWQSVIAL